MKSFKTIAVSMCAVLVMAGCNNMQKGAAIGAGGGAVPPIAPVVPQRRELLAGVHMPAALALLARGVARLGAGGVLRVNILVVVAEGGDGFGEYLPAV